MAGNPLIIFDRPLANPSFELGSVGSLPTSWVASGAGSGTRGISETDYWHRGSNEGIRSVKLLTTSGDFGIRQTVSPWYYLNQSVILMFLARNLDSGTGDLKAKVADLNGGGSELASTQTTFTIGASWTLCTIERVQNQASGVGIFVEFLAASGQNKNLLVDYVSFGRRVNFDRNFVDYRPGERARRQLNLGSGSYEAIELGDPVTDLSGNWGSVDEGSTLDLELHRFRGWARAHKPFAFWLDRDDHTNQGLHFGDCIGGPEFARDMQPGPKRYRWRMEAIAPKEWIAQAA